jgi:hypothetical protein
MSAIRHVSEWPQRQSDLICALELVIVNVPLAAPIERISHSAQGRR